MILWKSRFSNFLHIPVGYVEQGGDCLDDIITGALVYPNALNYAMDLITIAMN